MTKQRFAQVFTAMVLIIVLSMALIPYAYAENESKLEIYFLDVGEGDAAVILCDGYSLMIDGGASEYSDYIYSFLKNKNISRLDYIIATHPDADHIGGLSAALNYADAGCVMCTVRENNTQQFSNFVKYLTKQNNRIIIPDAGDVFSLGSASVAILGPKRGEQYSDNTSIALRISFGDNSFLFMGDNETEDEDVLISSKADLSADVLKVGHHGSASSTSASFLKKVKPSYSVISVGKDNSYGHPTEDVVKRLNSIGSEIYRTDINGIVYCISNGKSIEITCEKNGDAKETDVGKDSNVTRNVTTVPESTPMPERAATDYIVNTNSGKFHYPSCSSVKQMKESNKMYFSGSRDELVSKGYSPCGKCHP